MSALKRRTKVVIFRLTDDEYHDLKAACVTRGARNVSDFARNALMQSVTQEQEMVSEKLAQIESGVQRLERLIHGIAQRSPEEEHQPTH